MSAYRPRLKICGVARAEDARLVGECGADYCGILVGVGFSERNLDLEEASVAMPSCCAHDQWDLRAWSRRTPVPGLGCRAGHPWPPSSMPYDHDRRVRPMQTIIRTCQPRPPRDLRAGNHIRVT